MAFFNDTSVSFVDFPEPTLNIYVLFYILKNLIKS